MIKHGLTKHPLYNRWATMKKRCYQPNATSYKWYGARSIKVCDRWKHSFENFLADMGDAPGSDSFLDRINPDGDYEPDNVRWVTRGQSAGNRRGAHVKPVLVLEAPEVRKARRKAALRVLRFFKYLTIESLLAYPKRKPTNMTIRGKYSPRYQWLNENWVNIYHGYCVE